MQFKYEMISMWDIYEKLKTVKNFRIIVEASEVLTDAKEAKDVDLKLSNMEETKTEQ